MREVLDRLREAMTALDHELMELFHSEDSITRENAINLLWKAKQDIWLAQMHTLNAAASSEPETDD